MLKISKKLPASALLISLLILAGIFIIAFGAGYLSFFNTKNTDVYQQSARARAMAEAGVEAIKWEVGNNNFDLAVDCGPRILETELDDGSYYLKCALDSDNNPQIQSVGVYKKTSVTLNTGIYYDLATECTSTCLVGSLCGGGVLFSASPLLVAAPSGCTNEDGTGCDNSFTVLDDTSLVWDNAETPLTTSASDEDDGRVNALLLAGENYLGAQFCDGLIVNDFSDWYLPAKNELNTMLENSNYCSENSQGPNPLYCDHSTSTSPIIGGFAGDEIYISSTESDASDFLSQNFSTGLQATSTKSFGGLVRCLRRPL